MTSVNVNDLTIGQARGLITMIQAETGGKSHSFEVGRCYLIRSTFHHIGRLVAVTDTDLVLEGGGWLADSGRFSECLANGSVNEFEALPSPTTRRIVSRGDIIDAFEWNHEMPEKTK